MKPVPLPPLAHSRSRLYEEEFIDKMKTRRGEWFLVEEGREIRPNYGWAKRKIEGLEVATRKNSSGTHDVYARLL